MFVCEGIPGALSIAQSGGRAVALLGADLVDHRSATWLHDRHPNARLVLAFDADARGQVATRELFGRLDDLGHQAIDELALPSGIGDVNDWLTHDEAALRGAILWVPETRSGCCSTGLVLGREVPA
jgi:DNA primase